MVSGPEAAYHQIESFDVLNGLNLHKVMGIQYRPVKIKNELVIQDRYASRTLFGVQNEYTIRHNDMPGTFGSCSTSCRLHFCIPPT